MSAVFGDKAPMGQDNGGSGNDVLVISFPWTLLELMSCLARLSELWQRILERCEPASTKHVKISSRSMRGS